MVPPEGKAVVTRFGAVDRVLDPGLQVHFPFVEAVAIYPVGAERRFEFERDFELAGCAARVTLVYSVGDVVAFHKSEAKEDAVVTLENTVETGLAQMTRRTEDVEQDAAVLLRAQLVEMMPAGLMILRTQVKTRDCVTNPEEPATLVHTISIATSSAVLLSQRSAPFNTQLRLADDKMVELVGAVVTWDVTDQEKARVCFGPSSETAGERLIPLARNALRARSTEVNLDDAVQVTSDIATLMRSRAIVSEERCGIKIGDVDFGDAALMYRGPLQ